MDLVVDQRILGHPFMGITLYDNDSPGPPLLVIPDMHSVRKLNEQLTGYIGWADVSKPVVDVEEDQMPESYGGSK